MRSSSQHPWRSRGGKCVSQKSTVRNCAAALTRCCKRSTDIDGVRYKKNTRVVTLPGWELRSDDRYDSVSEILRDDLDGEVCKKQKRKGTFTCTYELHRL